MENDRRRITGYVDRTIILRIKAQAVREDRSVSDILRQLFKEYLEGHEGDN